jgi:serine/threonine protein phosphatase PrpC
MTFRQMLNGIVLVALLTSGVARAGDNAIRVSDEQGSPVAQFKVGDSRCMLKDDQVRCVPISK